MNKLNQMRMQKRGCDLVIKVERKEISVHRSVMIAGSDFFDAMLTHDMEEKQSGVVEMKEVSFRIFSKCVEFIYTGDIFLNVEDCEELLFAAGLLQLTSVCNNVSPFLQSRLTPSSFFATKRIADKFSLGNLKKVCNDFALKKLDEIVKEKEFDELEKEYISFLITSKKSIGSRSENSKMGIILQWIKADVENRQQYLIDLSTLLDFQRISPSLRKHLVMKEQMCAHSPEFMKMLCLASIDVSSAECKPPGISFGSSENNSLVIFDHSADVLRAFNPMSKNWTQMQGLHKDMNAGVDYTAVVLDNFIYVLLGNKQGYRLNMEVKLSQWEKVPNMQRSYHVPIAAACGDDIYVAGGHAMEKYHTGQSEWREVDCTGVSNCNYCALAVYDNFIYTIGGNKNGTYLADVNRFSPSTSSWSSVTSMPICQGFSAVTVLDDKIYVAGGASNDTNLNDFLCFDPRANSWIHLAPMINARHYFGLFLVESRLYAIGNYTNSCSIEMYDFETGKWTVVTNKDGNMKIMAPATVAIELPDS